MKWLGVGNRDLSMATVGFQSLANENSGKPRRISDNLALVYGVLRDYDEPGRST